MQGRRRKTALLAFVVALGALAILPSVASAFSLAPESPASGGAAAMRTIYIIMVVIAVLITVAVIAAVLGAVRGSRRPAEGRRTRGTAATQAQVGIGLTVVALAVFVVGVIFTESVREVEASESGADPITIQVDGQRWLWRYEYPNPDANATDDGYSGDIPYSYYELVVPVDTPIELEIGSTDLIHRWWVPALARQAGAVPGETHEISFLADQTGTYEGRSTEYSGSGYTAMRTRVRVVSEDEYVAWRTEQLEGIKEARAAVQEQVEAGTAPGVETQGEVTE